MLTRLTHQSSNCRLQRKYLLCPDQSLIVWVPGHCGLSGNELADHQIKLGSAETQPDSALAASTQRAIIHRFWRPLPIFHERMKELLLSLMSVSTRPFPQRNAPTWLMVIMVVTLLFDAGSIRWESLCGCRGCGGVVESAKHLWLRRLALLMKRYHSDLGHMMDNKRTNSSAIHPHFMRRNQNRRTISTPVVSQQPQLVDNTTTSCQYDNHNWKTTPTPVVSQQPQM